jgi:hypothetical protein
LVSAVGTRHLTITSRNVPDFYAGLLALLLQGAEDPSARNRLLKVLANDYAGQIAYDRTVGHSRRRRIAGWPPGLQRNAEFTFRCLSAAKLYASADYRDFSSVFQHPEYTEIKRIATAGEQT